jgi:hypothetical protein
MSDLLSPLLDGEGKLKRWPKKAEEREAALRYLLGKFEAGTDYAEKDVNAIIAGAHAFNDITLLRRELVAAKLMNRTPDCRRYWIEAR